MTTHNNPNRPNPDPAPRPQNEPNPNPRQPNEPVVDLRKPQPVARNPQQPATPTPAAAPPTHQGPPDETLRGRPKLTPYEWSRSPEKDQFTLDPSVNVYVRNTFTSPARNTNDPSPIKPGHPADTSFPAGGAPDPGNPDRRPR